MNDASRLEKIVGWGSLEHFVGRCEHVLRRLICFYSFPAPRKERKNVVWARSEVEAWLNNNELPAYGRSPRWV